jgi:hypothetical protein
MITTAVTGDPVSSLVLWTALAFLVWLPLTWCVRRLHVPHAGVITASLSWIIARLVLSSLPALIYHVGLWFGA